MFEETFKNETFNFLYVFMREHGGLSQEDIALLLLLSSYLIQTLVKPRYQSTGYMRVTRTVLSNSVKIVECSPSDSSTQQSTLMKRLITKGCLSYFFKHLPPGDAKMSNMSVLHKFTEKIFLQSELMQSSILELKCYNLAQFKRLSRLWHVRK